ncbi:hypothetical protein [Mycolicibacterium sphagni]|uniref:Uncharacterized protein n=1 Tax=Mycolicibacterium sphagni TaxID=1786 RepID=A0A255DBM4_9MYCO|nr:hypothetical protein [Mycolicibacterium sphagni]OYN76837.1 hypothetical protein CG716_20195 [Mycolicibacterium sphagni]
MPDEPRDHVVRDRLPWRTDDLTECGRTLDDVASHITRDQLMWRLKEHGKQRTAFTVCMTCWQTASDRSRESWETNPTALLSRQMRRGAGGIVYFDYRDPARTPHVDLMSAELHAIAALIEAHREEFDQRVAAASEAALFAHRRAQKERRRDG